MKNRLLFLSLLILPISHVVADNAGFMIRDAQLRASPNNDAKAVFNVEAGNTIKVIKRKGGWYQIKTTAEKMGWVRMTSLRLGTSAKKSGDSGILSTFSFFSKGNSENDNVVASTGVRGLDADDFAESQPDHQAVKKLDSYAVNKKAARNFAQAGNLKSVRIEYKDIVGGGK